MYGRNQSIDSQSRPLGKVDYSRADGADDPTLKNTSNPDLHHEVFTNEKRRPKPTSPWLKFGLPLALVLVVIAAVLGGVLGSRAHSSSSSTVAAAAASGAATGAGANAGRDASQVLFTGYNAYGVPQYPSSANKVFNTAPHLSTDSNLDWGTDPNAPDASGQTIRSDHPRLFASSHRWTRLPALIKQDPYMASWNATIFANATALYNQPPTNYSIDGGYSGSGVLDVGREIQLRIKHWGYAYRMSNDTKWVDRAWRELQVAAGNTTQPFGREGNNWNNE